MAGEVQEPRNSIWYGWDLGDSTWKAKMDANLKYIGMSMNLAVENQTTTSPPGSPSDGDAYIIGATASGAWTGKENYVAIYDDDITDWYYIGDTGGGDDADLVVGQLAWDKGATALYVWDGTNWTAV